MQDPTMPPGGGAGAPASSPHDALLQRFRQLSEDEQMALDQGVTPEAAAVIMKLMPELGAVLEEVLNEASTEPQMAEAEPAGDMGMAPRRPMTALGRV